jgi:hypothetical protein
MRVITILFVSIFMVISLFSCSKQKQTQRRLVGEWELISYKISDYEGLTQVATNVEGTINFITCSNADTTACTYEMSFTHSFPSWSDSTVQFGTYSVLSDGKMIQINQKNNAGSLFSSFIYRILTHTRNDLHVEYTDTNYNTHVLLFRRD